MPIINVPSNPPTPAPFPDNVTPNIYSPQYQSAVIDTDVQQLASLLTHIGGMPWAVDYYSQAVGANQNLSAYQPGQLAPYQQYYLIKGYELRVSSPLSSSQDPATGIMTITGSSTMYPFVIPNEGDVFIADVGDGRLGQFSITSVQRLTNLKQTCYTVNYTLQAYVTAQMQADLANKVVLTNYFVKDFMVYGKNPVVVDSAYNDMTWMKQTFPALLNRFLKQFYSPDFRTLIVPGQTTPTYDPYIVRAILAAIDKDAHPIIPKIAELNVDGLQVWDVETIWNTLLTTDYVDRDRLVSQVVLISAASFTYFGNMAFIPGMNYSGYNGTESIFFSRIQSVVYPYIPNGTTPDSPYNDYTMPSSSNMIPINDMTWDTVTLPPGNVPSGTLMATTTPLPTEPTNTAAIPVIHPVLSDSGYVLSNAFYTQAATGQSLLELLVNGFINMLPVNTQILLTIVETIPQWGKLEQFYYLPLVLILMKAAMVQGPQS